VDQSLVQPQAAGEEGGEEGAAPRFTRLQVMREYALERLEAGSEGGKEGHEAVAVRRAHATYFLELAEQAEPELRGSAQAAWLDRLERDHDNFRAALAWLLEEAMAEEAARLALALWPFWHVRTYLREGQRWLEQVLSLAGRALVAVALRARLMNALGVLAHTMGSFDRADAFHGEAIRLWSELGDHNGLAAAVLDRGWQHFYQLHLEQAQSCADESLALARQVGNRQAIAAALYLRAVPDSLPPPLTRHLKTSFRDREECLQIWRELGDTIGVASALSVLALGKINAGQYERAKPLLADALASHVQMGTIGSIGSTL
jgi:tetratricopeptide (TPR) repeat protein